MIFVMILQFALYIYGTFEQHSAVYVSKHAMTDKLLCELVCTQCKDVFC